MKFTCVALLGMVVGTEAFQARVAPWTGFQARAAPWTGFQARAAPWTGFQARAAPWTGFQARAAPWTGFQARAAPWTGFQARAAPWTGLSHARSSTSLSMSLHVLSDEEYKASLEAIGGYDIETGGKPLDPLKLAKWIPAETLRRYETVHCRVAMLACVGYAFPQIFGMFDSNDVTSANAIDALFQTAPEAWAQIVGACGIAEAQQWKHQQSGSDAPFYDPCLQWPKDAKKQEAMKLRELKNGRAAMLCWASFLSADLIAGSVPDFAIPF